MLKLVFLLEELSVAETLKGLLPRLLPEQVYWQLLPHEGKRDLERSIPRKLRGWREPGVRFVVVRDQDSSACEDVKHAIVQLCKEAGRPDSLVRIACHELEAWFLGDLGAVEHGMQARNIAKEQDRAKYREPDLLGNPAQELKRLAPTYQKVSGARSIGPYLHTDQNRSKSFLNFVQGVRKMAANSA